MKRWLVAVAALAPLVTSSTSAEAAPALHNAATARAGTGSLTIAITSSRALSRRGVTVGATGDATRRGRATTFRLASADAKALRTTGALRLRAKGRRVMLRSPRLELGSNPRVTALVGGRRSTLLTLAVAPVRTDSGVQLERTGATLTANAAKAIARRLEISALPRRSFATVSAAASFSAATTPGGPTPPGGSASGPCRTTTAAGAPPEPGTGEPPVKPRPASARTVTGATVTWRVRESFIRYMAAGEGTTVSRGAASAPAEALDGAPPLVYSFHFPFAEGWCDPVTGSARIVFTGTVAFRYADHEIDLVVNDPEVELDGPASRVIFRLTGTGDTAGGNRRAVVETLDVAKSAAAATAPTVGYERIPGAVPPGAASSVFAGYYLPGDPFGWVSISFTTA